MKYGVFFLTFFAFLIMMGYAAWDLFMHRGDDLTTGLSTSTAVISLATTSKQDIVDTLTNEEKVGMMVIAGFDTPYVDEHIKELITKYHISGVNLLSKNIKSPDQVKELTTNLQLLNRENSDVPFIIAVDQEGGSVVRLQFLSEKTAQPKIKSDTNAYAIAHRRGVELKNLGINMNFAPVVDFVSDPKSYLYQRTFATTTQSIAVLAQGMIQGYLDAGIMPVIKHFPGYGNVVLDPHKKEARFAGTIQEFEMALEPFKRLLVPGQFVPVMTAHIIVPFVSEQPATKAPEFMSQRLRDMWSYEGVVITDDLEMVSAGESIGQSAVESVKAGADMVIVTPTVQKHFEVINALADAVERGEITEERLNVSVKRIIELRKRLYVDEASDTR